MATHFDNDDDLWELAELYADLFPPRRHASALTDLDNSSFMHDFEILVFCKQFGIHDNETGKQIMPNNKQPVPGHVSVLTNQMLVYKHCRVILRIVIRRMESAAKTPKLNLRINLGISSDLGITNPRFILRF